MMLMMIMTKLRVTDDSDRTRLRSVPGDDDDDDDFKRPTAAVDIEEIHLLVAAIRA